METQGSLLEPGRTIDEVKKQKEPASKLERSSNGSAGDNVELLLEVEVTESLYAAMSREQGPSIEQSGLVEVTIIRPITGDPFTFSPHSVKTLSTIDECESVFPNKRHRQKPYRRPPTAMDRRRQYNPVKCPNKSFISERVENRAEVDVEEMGDLPREFLRKSKTHAKVRTKPSCPAAMGTQSGDHCNMNDIKSKAANSDHHSAAVEFIESYIKACDSKTEVRETGYRNTTLVYQVQQDNSTRLDPTLIELGTVEKILDQFEEKKFSKCDKNMGFIRKLQALVTEWASDEKQVQDFLSKDDSLSRCEHCGVISSAKVSGTSASRPLKMKKSQQFLEYRYLQDAKSYVADHLKTTRQMERKKESDERFSRCTSPRNLVENRGTEDKFEPPKNGSDVERHPEMKLRESTLQQDFHNSMLTLKQPCIETIHPPAVDTMTAERESDSASDNVKQLEFIQKDQVGSPMLLITPLNQCNTVAAIPSVDRKEEKCSDAIYRTCHTPRIKSKRATSQAGKRNVPCISHEQPEKSNTRSNAKIKPPEKLTCKVDKDGKVPVSKTQVERDVPNRNLCQQSNPMKRPFQKSKGEEIWQNSLRREIPHKERSKVPVDKIMVSPNVPSKPEPIAPIDLSPLTDTVKYLAQGQFASVDCKKKHTIHQFDEQLYVPWKKKQSFVLHGSHDDDDPRPESGLWLWDNPKSLADSIAEHLNRNQGMKNEEEKVNHNILSNSSEEKLYTVYGDKPKCVDEDNDEEWHTTKKHDNTFEETKLKNQGISNGSVQECLFSNKDSNEQHLEDSNSDYCNEDSGQLHESVTTGFSSSSAENMIREWTKPVVHISDCNNKSPASENNTEQPTFDVIRNIRTQITEAIEKCANYSVISEDKLYNYEESAEPRTLPGLDRTNEARQKATDTEYINYIIKQYEQLKETNWHDILDGGISQAPQTEAASLCKLENGALKVAHEFELENREKRMKIADKPSSKSTQDHNPSIKKVPRKVEDSKMLYIREQNRKMIRKSGESDANTADTAAELKIVREYNERYSHRLDKETFEIVKEVADTIWGEHTAKVASLKIAENNRNLEDCGSDERSLTKQQYIIISAPTTSTESPKSTLRMTYKNPASVLSSSSGENSAEDHRRLYLPGNSSSNAKLCDELQEDESERFERQITYDDISSRDISTGSREDDESKVLPVYRKILESNDEMDWETFQQLVETLHPSQRELWCDICKAVSNEAKRIAGETGASTEVCIEINPVPPGQAFAKGEKGKVRACGDEISFEMDMILKDVETFLDKNLGNTVLNPKTYSDRGNQNYGR